jgi:hypothetical protein
MRRPIVVLVTLAAAVGAPSALAGQPNASCEAAGVNPPPRFATGGFANAESHYAGSEGAAVRGPRQLEARRLAVRHRLIRRPPVSRRTTKVA